MLFIIALFIGIIILVFMYLRDRKKIKNAPLKIATVRGVASFIAQQVLLTGFLSWIAFAIILSFVFKIESDGIKGIIFLILAVVIGTLFGSRIGVKSAIKRFQIDFQKIDSISKNTAAQIVSITLFLTFLDFLTGEINTHEKLIGSVLIILFFIIIAYISFIWVRYSFRKFLKDPSKNLT